MPVYLCRAKDYGAFCNRLVQGEIRGGHLVDAEQQTYFEETLEEVKPGDKLKFSWRIEYILVQDIVYDGKMSIEDLESVAWDDRVFDGDDDGVLLINDCNVVDVDVEKLEETG